MSVRAVILHDGLIQAPWHSLSVAELGGHLKPYARLARLDKPIGTWLLLWPCLWSIVLATPRGTVPNLALMASFGLGALVWRGAGCTINDLCDRELDVRVERTRTRPLAAGDVRVWQALAFLALQLVVGVTWFCTLTPLAKQVGLASVGMVGTYPLMKRVTHWPQLFLGFTYNWGAMMGWAATGLPMRWHVILPLYAAGIFWTLLYDTIYANQDKECDRKVGVKSSALALGELNGAALVGFALASTSLLVAAGVAAGSGPAYYVGIAGVALHFTWQLAGLDLNDPRACGDRFRSNTWVGLLVFLGMAADRLLLAV